MTVATVVLVVLSSIASASGVTVRVQPTPGGPQIFVDGKPVRPRVFYGSRRGGYCRTTTGWREYAFKFTPTVAARQCATLHFRFDKQPCEYWIKDVRIVDTITGKDVLTPHSFASDAAFMLSHMLAGLFGFL